jgi:DNA-binding LytR/AlgR family response regulator
MIIKTVIIDDEPENVAMLKEAIKEIHDVEVIDTFNSGEEFFKVFKKLKFDLCVIDYHLPGMNGMTCAKRLTDKKIIMESPESIPADEAMELDEVVDVIKIVKPLNKERLIKAIKKVRDELMAERGYMIIKTYPHNIRQLKLEDILYIKSDGEIKYVMTHSEAIRTQAYNLKQLLDKLPDDNFCQINKSQIINTNYFHSFIDSDSIKLFYEPSKFEVELTIGNAYYLNFAQLVGIHED